MAIRSSLDGDSAVIIAITASPGMALAIANTITVTPSRTGRPNKSLRRMYVTIDDARSLGGGGFCDLLVVTRVVLSRHCERSEAKQSSYFLAATGLLRRFAPRNDESRITA